MSKFVAVLLIPFVGFVVQTGAFAEELEMVAADANDVSSAAAAVLDLVGSRVGVAGRVDAESPDPCPPSHASEAGESGFAPERFGAATEHLTALCKVILGRS